MGYLCATCGGLGGLFKTSHAHSDKDSCISELRARLDAGSKENAKLLLQKHDIEQAILYALEAFGPVARTGRCAQGGEQTGNSEHVEVAYSRLQKAVGIEKPVDLCECGHAQTLHGNHELGCMAGPCDAVCKCKKFSLKPKSECRWKPLDPMGSCPSCGKQHGDYEVTGERKDDFNAELKPGDKFGPPQCTCMGFFKMKCAVHH